jgi:hypothetical protein
LEYSFSFTIKRLQAPDVDYFSGGVMINFHCSVLKEFAYFVWSLCWFIHFFSFVHIDSSMVLEFWHALGITCGKNLPFLQNVILLFVLAEVSCLKYLVSFLVGV